MNDRLPIDGPSMQTLRRERDAAIAERDRLRRELEALRDELDQRSARWLDMAPGQRPSVIGEAVGIARRLDAILRGGES